MIFVKLPTDVNVLSCAADVLVPGASAQVYTFFTSFNLILFLFLTVFSFRATGALRSLLPHPLTPPICSTVRCNRSCTVGCPVCSKAKPLTWHTVL